MGARCAEDLRMAGFDVRLDQWHLRLGEDVSLFMQRGIAESDRVLCVCSEEYAKKADGGAGGVGYERQIITEELVRSIDTRKFIPAIRNNPGPKKMPTCLGPRKYIDFTSDAAYTDRLSELILDLRGGPTPPPIGSGFAGAPGAPPTRVRTVLISGLTAAGRSPTDDDWFAAQQTTANAGLTTLKLAGAMQVRSALHEPTRKSQIELLNAVRNSEIKTFGWPIAVLLENRDDFRPKPVADGIQAEIAITEGVHGEFQIREHSLLVSRFC